MPYLIETFDKPNCQHVRKNLRPDHLVFLQENSALLLACGAKLNDDGSDAGGGIYIVDLETRKEAEAFIESDPFFKGDLFFEIRITCWRKAYIDRKSFL